MKVNAQFIGLITGVLATAGIGGFFSLGVSAQSMGAPAPRVVLAQQKDVQFICAEGYDAAADRRFPTTYAWTPRGKLPVIRWKTNYFSDAGYKPQGRCEIASKKFDKAYRSGMFDYLGVGKQNGETVICTVKERPKEGQVTPCLVELMTLRRGDNPEKIVAELVKVLKGKGVGPIEHAGKKTKPYYSEKSWSYHSINVEDFLSTATPDPDPDTNPK